MATKDKHKTDVIFRKYRPSHNFGHKGTILAVFPHEPYNRTGKTVTCYEFCGQHGEAAYDHVINSMTTPATEDESRELKEHLEKQFGYNFNIVKRRNYNKFIKLLKSMQ